MYSYMAVTGIAIIYWFWPVINHLTPKGLVVYFPKLGTFARANEPWNEPLVVRVDAEGNLYLNRQPVPRSDLDRRLRQVLKLRDDWTVFVDAGPDVDAGNVIWAADLLQGMGIRKVALVTPSMKREVPSLAAEPPCEIHALQDQVLPLPRRQGGENWGFYYPAVSYNVSERGDVSNVIIQKSSGNKEIDDWAVHSVRRWKYTPAPGCGKHMMERYLRGSFW
jgi:TonB family protein